MDLGLGLGLNSFAGFQGTKTFGGAPASSSVVPETEGFESYLAPMQNGQNGQVESQGFGKPIASPIQESALPMSGFFQTNTVERIIPQAAQPTESLTGAQAVGNQKIDTLTKRVAWQKFLQKMKSELDVSAEEILAAFQALTPQELQQPPEKNINKLVANLGLNPEQSQVASRLFQDLIQKTGSQPLAQELKTSSKDITLSVMSQRDQEQKRMAEALEKMNQKFFMKEPKKESERTEASLLGGMAAASAPTEALSVPSAPVAPSAMPAGGIEVLQSGKEISSELLAEMTPVDEEEAQRFAESLAKQTDSNAAIQPELQSNQAQNLAAGTNLVENEASEDFVEKMKAPLSDTAAAVKPQTEKVVAKSSSKGADLFSKGGESSAYATSIPVENMSEAVLDKTSFNEALGATGAAAASSQETVSTEDLIQQARMMVRDGGGEVKVILEPEGLGEVAMKVSVAGDKVNIEMITESDTAKKMLEKGMGDLKSHLLASNLNLESIKVDTASQLGQQLEQQYQDAQRQQAQAFMEQFRQGNQDFKRGFLDLPGAKLYQSQTKAKAPAVEATSSPKAKEGRRLNLVA